MTKDKTIWLKYDGNSFNATVLGKLTKDQFIAHEGHNFTAEGGAEQMEDLYKKIQARVKPNEEAVPKGKKMPEEAK